MLWHGQVGNVPILSLPLPKPALSPVYTVRRTVLASRHLGCEDRYSRLSSGTPESNRRRRCRFPTFSSNGLSSADCSQSSAWTAITSSIYSQSVHDPISCFRYPNPRQDPGETHRNRDRFRPRHVSSETHCPAVPNTRTLTISQRQSNSSTNRPRWIRRLHQRHTSKQAVSRRGCVRDYISWPQSNRSSRRRLKAQRRRIGSRNQRPRSRSAEHHDRQRRHRTSETAAGPDRRRLQADVRGQCLWRAELLLHCRESHDQVWASHRGSSWYGRSLTVVMKAH